MDEAFVPACLPIKKAPGPGTTCYVAGIKGSSMKTTPMKILSKNECRKLSIMEYNEYDKDLEVFQWDICAVNPTNEDCIQNIGSSLICKENGKAVVYRAQ